jgi:hypothetical protein
MRTRSRRGLRLVSQTKKRGFDFAVAKYFHAAPLPTCLVLFELAAASTGSETTNQTVCWAAHY